MRDTGTTNQSGIRLWRSFLVLVLLVLSGMAILLIPLFFPNCEGPYAHDLSPETLNPAKFDISLLTGTPCEPPCWLGIVPGQTTDAEMDTILEGLSLPEADTIDRKSETAITFYQASEREDVLLGYGTVSIMLLDDVVTTIDVNLHYDLELHQLIDRIGEPTGYFVQTYPPPDAIRLGPGCVDADLMVVWPEHGLMTVSSFYMRDPPRRSGRLFSRSDRLYIHDVIYSPAASSVWEYLLARHYYPSTAEQTIERDYQLWRGEDAITLPAYYME